MHTFYRKLRLYNDLILVWAIKIYTCASIFSSKGLPVLWQFASYSKAIRYVECQTVS